MPFSRHLCEIMLAYIFFCLLELNPLSWRCQRHALPTELQSTTLFDSDSDCDGLVLEADRRGTWVEGRDPWGCSAPDHHTAM